MQASLRILDMCSNTSELVSTLKALIMGYQTLKNIMDRYCSVLKEDGIAEELLLTYRTTDLIPRRAQKVHLGQTFSKY